MIKLIRRNQKKAAAFFGVFLMITFAFSFGKGGGGQGGNDPEIATINGTAIHMSDAATAKAEIRALRDNFGIDVPFSRGDAEKQPIELIMLREEAKKAGLRPGADQVKTIMARAFVNPAQDPDVTQVAEMAISDWILINERFGQISSYDKVTKPALDQKLVSSSQKVVFNVVPVPADAYLSATTKPTDAQMQKQFDAFAATTPEMPSEPANPLGFGYRLPVKQSVQYLQFDRDALEQGVIARTSYDWSVVGPNPASQALMYMKVIDHYWKVAGQKYYHTHLDDFKKPLTPDGPAVQQDINDPAVLADAVRKVRDPLITSLEEQLKTHLSDLLTKDWTAYQLWLTSGGKGVEPVSSVGVPYSAADYFTKVADSVTKSPAFMVPMTAGKTDAPASGPELLIAKGYGSTPLSVFAAATAEQVIKMGDVHAPAATAVMMKTSDALSSYSTPTTKPTDAPDITPKSVATTTFARLTDVLPSVPPANLAAVAPQVEKDLRLAQAYQLAQDDSEKLLVAAGKGNLALTAWDFKHLTLVFLKPVSAAMTVPSRNPNPYDFNDPSDQLRTALENIDPPLTTDQERTFVKQALKALDTYSVETNRNPATIVKIPGVPRVFVVQVTSVFSDWSVPGATGNQFYSAAFKAKSTLEDEQKAALLRDWFDFAKLSARVDYKPIKQRGN